MNGMEGDRDRPGRDHPGAGGHPVAVRCITVVAVLLVAAVAAVVSYAHMQEVARDAGEGWRAYLLPLSVDGLVVAASMVLLTRRRVGLPGGWLAWCALLGGVGASLAANIAAAEPTTTARMVASWPAVAFAVAFELLLQQRRVAVAGPVGGDPPAGDSVGDVGEPARPSRVARETPVPSPHRPSRSPRCPPNRRTGWPYWATARPIRVTGCP